jgi:type II secretory pathway component GspD/PulD (secretin)
MQMDQLNFWNSGIGLESLVLTRITGTPVVIGNEDSACSRRRPRSWRTALLCVTMSVGLVHAAIAEVDTSASLQASPANAVNPLATNAAVATITSDYTADGLRMNFHGALLSMVLDYLSDAAGFIINKQTNVRGTVEVWSKQPISKEEAIELLSSVLKKNGYGLTRNGRILTIVALDTVKTADTDVVVSHNPNEVQKSDEIQTQIIPVRYATASQLVPNLELLLPSTATLSANESANTLILVATRTDIKRMLRIVSALDDSMAASSSIKVRPLRYADAKETANLITQLFSQQSSPQTVQDGPGFGGGGDPFGGGPAMGTQAANNANRSGRNSSVRVVAVADDRSNSVVISAPADLLATIGDMLDKLDRQVGGLTELRVFRLTNADPAELAEQLAQLFPDGASSSNSNQNNNSPFFFPGGDGPTRGSATTTDTGTSERSKTLGKVLAISDPRTSSLIVTASRTLMPQVAQMIAGLDADRGKREVVSYFELRNADPQDVYQNLQDLFNRSSVRQQNNNSQNSFLGRSNPLTQRQTQNQQSTTETTMNSGLGNSSGNSTAGR